jgi:suppressor of G2 allele of SKP1
MAEPNKIKHDWYQTETAVVVEVRIKGLKKEDVKVEFAATSLSVAAKLPSASEYCLELDLAHPVLDAECSYKVLGTKIEIKMKKKTGTRWEALEGAGADPMAGAGGMAAANKTTEPLKYPSSSGKDWNKITTDIEKSLEDDKEEGEAALNSMFQKIYGDGSDEVKKAMNKSFAESGGTVLSTNWSDIKKDKVDVKPPDGMEYKKWD